MSISITTQGHLTISDLNDGRGIVYEEDWYKISASTNETFDGENIIPYPYANDTKIENGLSWTLNGNGSVTVSGTATADTHFRFFTSAENVKLNEGTYAISGCPSGGSASTYYLQAYHMSSPTTSVVEYTKDTGIGATFTQTSSYVNHYVGVRATVKSGTTVDNLTFYPLLENITNGSSEWSKKVLSPTANKKYLWFYEVTTYSDGTTSTWGPVVIGTYGEKGEKGDTGDAGVNFEYDHRLLYLSTSNTTAPSAPNAAVAQTRDVSGEWTQGVPTWTSGKYYWTCHEIKTSASTTPTWTTVVLDNNRTQSAATAASASALAGSKNTVYYASASSALPSSVKNGDIWIQTQTSTGTADGVAGSRIMYLYENNDWNQVKFGSGSLVAGTVVADLIAGNAITADKIATGAITADKMESGSVTVRMLADENSYGDNLFINTLKPGLFSGPTASATASERDNRPRLIGQTTYTYTSSGTLTTAQHGMRLTNTAATRPVIRWGGSGTTAGFSGLEPGKTYTVAFDYSCKLFSGTTESTTRYLTFYQYSAFSGGTAQEAQERKAVATYTAAEKGSEKSGSFLFTFTIPAESTAISLRLQGTQSDNSYYAAGDYVEIRNLILVEGSFSQLSWVASSKDSISSTDLVTSGATVINGANITTGKLAAKYIDLYGNMAVYKPLVDANGNPILDDDLNEQKDPEHVGGSIGYKAGSYAENAYYTDSATYKEGVINSTGGVDTGSTGEYYSTYIIVSAGTTVTAIYDTATISSFVLAEYSVSNGTTTFIKKTSLANNGSIALSASTTHIRIGVTVSTAEPTEEDAASVKLHYMKTSATNGMAISHETDSSLHYLIVTDSGIRLQEHRSKTDDVWGDSASAYLAGGTFVANSGFRVLGTSDFRNTVSFRSRTTFYSPPYFDASIGDRNTIYDMTQNGWTIRPWIFYYNSNWNSNFSAQSITNDDIKDFGLFYVGIHWSTDYTPASSTPYPYRQSGMWVRVDPNSWAQITPSVIWYSSSKPAHVYRDITIDRSTGTITFGTGEYVNASSHTTNAKYAIPTYIIGFNPQNDAANGTDIQEVIS